MGRRKEPDQLQKTKDFCDKCPYDVPGKYERGEIPLKYSEQGARWACAHCCYTGTGIYKFDIIQNLITVKKIKSTWKGKGKTATRIKRYGQAVKKLVAEMKTTRQIADILGISTTTITQIKKELNIQKTTKKDSKAKEREGG